MADPITSASFADSFIPAPPSFDMQGEPQTQTDAYLRDVSTFLKNQWYALIDMQSSIASGWLIDTVRILNLEAGTITSGSIFTQDLYVGDDQLIVLSGTTNTIEVFDEAATLRVRLGDLGAGATNWGAEFWNSSGSLIMSIGDTVFIDGAILIDATITNAKILNSTIDGSTKLANSSVTNAKVASGLSATKVTTGTLTVSSATVAISVTSGGAVVLSNGADIIFKASASGNTNYIDFQTSSGVTRSTLSFLTGSQTFEVSTVSGVDLSIDSGSELRITSAADIVLNPGGGFSIYLGLTSADTVSFGGRIATNITPTVNKVWDIGTAALAFDEIYGDNFNNVADIRFQNGMVVLEADKVYKGLAGEVGEFWLGPDKKPKFLLGADGTLYITGKVVPNVNFDAMFAEYKPIDYHKRLRKNAERKAKELQQIALNEKARDDRRRHRLAKYSTI